MYVILGVASAQGHSNMSHVDRDKKILIQIAVSRSEWILSVECIFLRHYVRLNVSPKVRHTRADRLR
jgi:hypothetical protein